MRFRSALMRAAVAEGALQWQRQKISGRLRRQALLIVYKTSLIRPSAASSQLPLVTAAPMHAAASSFCHHGPCPETAQRSTPAPPLAPRATSPPRPAAPTQQGRAHCRPGAAGPRAAHTHLAARTTHAREPGTTQGSERASASGTHRRKHTHASEMLPPASCEAPAKRRRAATRRPLAALPHPAAAPARRKRRCGALRHIIPL